MTRFLDWLDESAAGVIRIAYLLAGVIAVASYFSDGNVPRSFSDLLNAILPWALAGALEIHTYLTARRVRAAWQDRSAASVGSDAHERAGAQMNVNLWILGALLAFSMYNQLQYLAATWTPPHTPLTPPGPWAYIIRAIITPAAFMAAAFLAPVGEGLAVQVQSQAHALAVMTFKVATATMETPPTRDATGGPGRDRRARSARRRSGGAARNRSHLASDATSWRAPSATDARRAPIRAGRAHRARDRTTAAAHRARDAHGCAFEWIRRGGVVRTSGGAPLAASAATAAARCSSRQRIREGGTYPPADRRLTRSGRPHGMGQRSAHDQGHARRYWHESERRRRLGTYLQGGATHRRRERHVQRRGPARTVARRNGQPVDQ